MDYNEFVLDPPIDTVDGYKIWYRDLMSFIMVIGGLLMMCFSFGIVEVLSRSGYTWLAFIVWPIMLFGGAGIIAFGTMCKDETSQERWHGDKAESRKQFYYFMSKTGDIYNPKDVKRPMPEDV
jgi:hypothetical protein